VNDAAESPLRKVMDPMQNDYMAIIDAARILFSDIQ
jgi:hypothetical protein